MSRVSRLLNKTVQVWRVSRTSDGMGGWIDAPALVGSARCRVSQPSAVERVTATQAGATLTHVIYLEPDAGVLRGDELRLGSRPFEVLAVFEPSEPGTYLRANCEERQASPA